ncbi:MAG TPA: GNAT family N-acetyltransferase [Myxococcales bacterium]|nr:GNAT family N-acetyltransferase [Myxococcales bacterium]
MPAAAAATRLRVLTGVNEVPREAWDALAGPDAPPFVRWDWLDALESSGSASARTGWQPQHLTLWRGQRLVAASPAYVKHHSMGEYIYDFGWASAADALGVEYYPKLLVGAPLSPITAPRLLVAPGEPAAELRQELARAAEEVAKEAGCSSVHVIFPSDAEAGLLEELGWARRLTMQYHWKNPGYRSFGDYLGRFTSKRRHQIKREKGAAAAQGISIVTRRGADLGKEHAALAYRLYESTCHKFAWGRIQLNRGFFTRAFETLAPFMEVVEATRGGEVIAGAFNLSAGGRLFGRYWGCFEDVPFLHFNVCLYHSIEECIALGRTVFEPGAGGEHKIARGFEPTAIHSAHLIFNRKLDRAIRDALRRERAQTEPLLAQSEEISGMKPWVSAGPGSGA